MLLTLYYNINIDKYMLTFVIIVNNLKLNLVKKSNSNNILFYKMNLLQIFYDFSIKK